MTRLQGLSVLMGVAMLGITGFQVYWLKQNYDREEKTLGIKTEVTFRETIQHLQAAKLKLDMLPSDSIPDGKLRIWTSGNNPERVTAKFIPSENIISTINVVKSRLRDSVDKKQELKTGMIISLDKSSVDIRRDSTKFNRRIEQGLKNHLFSLMYGVDSLQDSLKLPEINIAFARALKEQNLHVPFSVERLDSCCLPDEHILNQVTVGFMNPVTYQMNLGNTFPYLLKRISLPILFSFVLLGITILSFVLLYRNLLRQKRLAALKNEFISNITHELKTPIATVGVAIEALRSFNAMEDPRRTKEYLDISSNELQRLGLLVDKVLKLSMFEKKEIELKYEALNLGDVVEEVVSSLRLQLEKHHARVNITKEGDLGMEGDRLHLQSVVFNLLDNALKYGKEVPAIQIHLKEKDNAVTMNITDNGIGIPSEYKDRIFDKFFRVPHGDTHNAKGYGLGLSYVAHVVQRHRGEIQIESQPGIGTQFMITLPKNNG
ncbi:MAG TPA: HAMP domain-containing sensor histidine kinase [Chitinophagaceae bacterium]|nr:HAMP domain-containing sensor histidine kinase [Chitinophagaceae bacterium]